LIVLDLQEFDFCQSGNRLGRVQAAWNPFQLVEDFLCFG